MVNEWNEVDFESSGIPAWYTPTEALIANAIRIAKRNHVENPLEKPRKAREQ
jgi:hypothetical protein